jgi:hypothetical protein
VGGFEILTFHQRPALTAVPPPRIHPAIWSVSVQATPADPPFQILLHSPGISNHVRLYPSNHPLSGRNAIYNISVAPITGEPNLLPPHLADEATPFSISRTLCPAAESLSAIGIPAAPPPTTT